MKKDFEDALAKVGNINEVEIAVLKLLGDTRNHKGHSQVGFVSGSVFSDGPEFIQRNIRQLAAYADKVRSQHPFPIFSAYDIFYSGLFEKLPESKLPYEVRRPKFFAFWKKVVECGHITDVFMAPMWEKSEGATYEHDNAKKRGIRVHYIEFSDEIAGFQ